MLVQPSARSLTQPVTNKGSKSMPIGPAFDSRVHTNLEDEILILENSKVYDGLLWWPKRAGTKGPTPSPESNTNKQIWTSNSPLSAYKNCTTSFSTSRLSLSSLEAYQTPDPALSVWSILPTPPFNIKKSHKSRPYLPPYRGYTTPRCMDLQMPIST